MNDEQEIIVLRSAIGARMQAGQKPDGIARALWEAGYRLDPYPNGKSKGELIARIETVEAERNALLAQLKKRFRIGDRAIGPYGEECVIAAWVLETKEHFINPDDNVQAPFLAETSTVKP